jgi:hypothetical protein
LCPVTQNLLAALHHLRRRDSDRVLWIDALCIDQANVEEKEQQVVRMDRIYQTARNVCVWLGPGTDDSDKAMAAVPSLLGSIWNTSHNYDLYYWDLFARLLQRDWFSRRWVVQEIALAKEATVQCGNQEVSWDDFSDVISLYGSRQAGTWSSTPASPDARGLGASTLSFLSANALRKDGQGNILEHRWSLEDLLALLPMFHVQKPHDAVYSVLSVTSDDNPSEYIDYSRPQTELFVSVFKHIAHSTNSLDMMFRPWAPDTPGTRLPSFIAPASRHPYIRDANGLYERRNADSLVGAPRRPIYAATRPPLASSPLLTLPVVRGRGNKFISRTAGITMGDSGTRNNSTLAVKGVLCCFISELGDVCEDGVIPWGWVETWRQRQEDGQMPDLWRVLVAGRSHDGTAAPNWFRRAFDSTFSPEKSILNERGVDLPAMLKAASLSNVANYLRRVSSCVWGRRLLVSTEESAGYFGLVPREAAPGDMICLLEGCSVPVVFRGGSITKLVLRALQREFDLLGPEIEQAAALRRGPERYEPPERSLTRADKIVASLQCMACLLLVECGGWYTSEELRLSFLGYADERRETRSLDFGPFSDGLVVCRGLPEDQCVDYFYPLFEHSLRDSLPRTLMGSLHSTLRRLSTQAWQCGSESARQTFSEVVEGVMENLIGSPSNAGLAPASPEQDPAWPSAPVHQVFQPWFAQACEKHTSAFLQEIWKEQVKRVFRPPCLDPELAGHDHKVLQARVVAFERAVDVVWAAAWEQAWTASSHLVPEAWSAELVRGVGGQPLHEAVDSWIGKRVGTKAAYGGEIIGECYIQGLMDGEWWNASDGTEREAEVFIIA